MRRLLTRIDQRMLISAVIALTFCLSAMFGLSVSYSSDHIDNAVRESPTIAKALALTARDPIYIVGNTGFTNESGVVWGSGTASDPYLIDGWEIDAVGQYGIEVLNADAHFIIRNVVVYNGSWGILVGFSSNGTVSHCTVSDTSIAIIISGSRNEASDNVVTSCYFGISVESSDGNGSLVSNNSVSFATDEGIYIIGNNHTISRNHIQSCNRGIRTNGALYITIKDNNCSDNVFGIQLDSSDNCRISANTCNYNDMNGITVGLMAGSYVYPSNNSVLKENICNSNGADGIKISSSHNNTLYNNTCSMNNQAGISATQSSNNTFISNGCDSNTQQGIMLYSSTNNTLANCICTNNQGGLLLWMSSNNTLVNNSCSFNTLGMILSSSTNNTLVNNKCMGNAQHGVLVYGTSSNGNRVWNNSLIGNNGATDVYDASHIQAYDGGANNCWNSTDGYGNYWSDWTGPDDDMDGIVDVPYDIAGSAGAKDYYPLTTAPPPIPEFGTMLLVVIVFLVAVFLMSGATRRKAQ